MHILVFAVQIIRGLFITLYPLFFLIGVLFFAVPRLRNTRPRRVLMYLFLAAGFLGLFGRSYYVLWPKPEHLTWGVTFSQKMAGDLRLDWKDAYRAILYDLRPNAVRLVAYWDLIEPLEGAYDFADLDFQMREAVAAKIPIVLTIGQKVPRWPECHLPEDLGLRNQELVRRRLLNYLETVVKRYKGSPALSAWQIENEPFFPFGECPPGTAEILGDEIALVRRLDPEHSIMTTDSGEFGEWYRAAEAADAVGTTLYRTVHHKTFGRVTYPLPPEFYASKRDVVKFFTGKWNEPFIIAELDAEPWGPKQISEMTANEQTALFSLDDLASSVDYAKRTGFDTFYFWGVEWWYSLKTVHNDSRYWDFAKSVMKNP